MPEAGPTAQAFSDNLLAEFAEVVAMLALVLMIFLALAWLYKKFSVSHARSHAPAQVLGSASLGGKERLVVVQVEDARLVLGVTSASVNVLHVLGESIAGAKAQPGAHDTNEQTFGSILSQSLNKKERSSC